MFQYLMQFLCNIEETVTISKREYDNLKRENSELKQALSEALSLIKELQIEVNNLRTEIKLLKNGRNSRTSSTPSSHDYGRGNKFNSREKSGRKPGGQKGHGGSSLKMSKSPDETIKYFPKYCKQCGEEFNAGSVSELHGRKQEIVIPPIRPKYVEHRSYSCCCHNCNTKTSGDLPSYLKANIQYGKNIQALMSYLSVYQYLPSNRIKSFFNDVMNIPISEGTIYNILESMSKKAEPVYKTIEGLIAKSRVVGGDESGVKINGDKAWFWVFQNSLLTYIKVTSSRAYESIVETFPNGFPDSVYVSDSLAAQLKISTKSKQLCLAHLLRELSNFEQAFNCTWSPEMKQLFKSAISHKKEMSINDYFQVGERVKEFENKLTGLLELDCSNKHKKQKAFVNRLLKNRNNIFTFLYYHEVPPDNNGSERAIRNAKVKMKISNQFKSFDFANHYAVIRSVIDTTIKNSNDVFTALTYLAEQKLVAAE
jgi:transposase